MSEENYNETIERIVKEGITLEVGEHTFTPQQSYMVKDICHAQPIELYNLTSIANYVNNFELSNERLIIQVKDEKRVLVMSDLDSKFKTRSIYVNGVEHPDLETFDVNRFMELEDFRIGLRSFFEKSDIRTDLLEYLSNITKADEVSLKDNGASEEVLVSDKTTNKTYTLKTKPDNMVLNQIQGFSEIKNPKRSYTFRMKTGGICALYENDGGIWRISTMDEIRKFLTSNITRKDVVII